MAFVLQIFSWKVALIGAALAGAALAQNPAQIESGQGQFVAQCAFCHGRDAAGGEDGPDLTRSELVIQDKAGDKIGPVVRNGRTEHGMPRFNVSDQDLAALVAFIHNQEKMMKSQNGQRRGVDVSDVQTGNLEKGRAYFNGAGTCSTCHSATGDLKGLATRLQGLRLIQRFLYPRGAKATMTLTTAKGETFTGDLIYRDEFNVALRDASGKYVAFPAKSVKVTVNDPAEVHAGLLAKYTDDDIHNMMAYLQSLK